MKKIIVVLLLVMSIVQVAYAEEEVEVVLPYFDITLNGVAVDNTSETYPFIQYKGITYIPMTWDLCKALGLRTKWSEEEGLEILKADTAVFYNSSGKAKNVVGKKYKAELVDFPVKVNGKVIDNSTEEYPILNYKNITYFPMTYHFMVNEFNSGYKWDDIVGLSVAADESLEMTCPEPITFEYKMMLEEFRKTDLLIQDQWKVYERSDYNNGLIEINQTMPEYNGMIMDVEVDYFDKYGRYWFTEKILTGVEYKGFDEKTHYGDGHLFNFYEEEQVVAFNVRMTFTSKAVAEFKTNKAIKDQKINVKIIDSDQINKDYLSSLGHYFSGRGSKMIDVNVSPSDKAIEYAAIKHVSDGHVKGEPKDIAYHRVNGQDTIKLFEPASSLYKINTYSKYDVDVDLDYGNLKVFSGDTLADSFYCDFIYIYNENKELTTILAIKDMIYSRVRMLR